MMEEDSSSNTSRSRSNIRIRRYRRSNKDKKNDERKYYKKALSYLIKESINRLKGQILKLKEIEVLNLKENSDVSKYLKAFENIKEDLKKLEFYQDYYKIGGFVVLPACFRCENSKIRTTCVNFIGYLSENDYCKDIITSSNVFLHLLESFEKEENTEVANVEVMAIGKILMHNAPAYQTFVNCKGLETMLKILKNNVDDQLETNTIVLLTNMCREEPEIKANVITVGYLPVLVELLTKCQKTVTKYVLNLTLTIAKNNEIAIKQLRNPKYRMQEILLECWEISKKNRNDEDMEDLCLDLMSLLKLPEIS